MTFSALKDGFTNTCYDCQENTFKDGNKLQLPSFKIPDLQAGQKYYDVNFIKETAKDSISLIKELNATYNDYLKRLNGLIEKAISSINISFGKIYSNKILANS